MKHTELKQEIESCVDEVSSLLPVYKKINEMCYYMQWDKANLMLELIDVEKICDVLLTGLLRLTTYYKQHLKYWNTFLFKCSMELKRRGYNPDKSLRGLSNNTFTG